MCERTDRQEDDFKNSTNARSTNFTGNRAFPVLFESTRNSFYAVGSTEFERLRVADARKFHELSYIALRR
jgi:hypothetical protein